MVESMRLHRMTKPDAKSISLRNALIFATLTRTLSPRRNLLAVAAAFDDVFFFVVVVVVVGERRELHQAFDEIVVEFDEEAEVSQAVDEAAELFAHLGHHELGFLESDHFALGVHGVALAFGGVFAGFCKVATEIVAFLGL